MDAMEVIRRLINELLPGGGGFPDAASLCCEALLLDRLQHADPALPVRLIDAPSAAALQTENPAAFAMLRKQAYLVYYEQPAVIAAIRALGHPYNDRPLPNGYPAETFDPARDAPTSNRGRWLATDAVVPVDVAALGLDR